MNRNRVTSIVVAAIAAATLAACSSGGGSGTTASSAPASAATSSSAGAAASGSSQAASAASSAGGSSTAAASGASGASGAAGKSLKGKLVWYMGVTAANPATNAIAQGMAKVVNASGATFVRSFAFNNTSGQVDIALQAQAFVNATNQHADAIAYFLISPSAPKPQILAAEKAGIPVFAAFGKPDGFTVNGYLSNPDYQNGYVTAQYLAKQLPKGAQVTILDGPDTLNVNNEVSGAQAALKAAGLDLVGNVNSQRNLSDNTAGGQSTMQGILQHYPDVKGVFVYNDDSALGAIAAAKSANKHILFVSRNGEAAAVQAVRNGSLLATCDVKPIDLGETMGRALVAQLQGTKNYKNTELPAPPASDCLVTKANAGSWVAPDKQITYVNIPTK